MPKYVYSCNSCGKFFEVYHGMSEDQDNCIYCSANDLNRVPQMPFLKRSQKREGSKVGDEVKRAIEENRAILKDAKKEAKREIYDD